MVASTEQQREHEAADELDRFDGATDSTPVPQRAAHIDRLLLDDEPAAYLLLARDDSPIRVWPSAK